MIWMPMIGFAVCALGVVTLEIRPDSGPDSTLRDELRRLRRWRIFFGHQSVGTNLLEGVRELAARCPDAELRIVELNRPVELPPETFAHALLPENGNPSLKLKNFERALASGGPDVADVAFFKFCYVDFSGATDVPRLFAEYQAALKQIHDIHPSTRIVHMTAPLTRVEAGAKARLKRLLWRVPGGLLENIRRDHFNRLMRAAYHDKEPVFDLALFECTAPDGRREVHKHNGHEVPALLPAYTNDGGHLNDDGRERIARRLISFLAALTGRT